MADFSVVGNLKIEGDGPKTLKELKTSIRAAKDELIAMQTKFGETSTEAVKAAKAVAQLEDKLGDAKQLSDSFNPDQKFRALSGALNGVLGGFTALTGAMGLLGVESEQVQKQLLKVQSALALSQGLSQVGEMTKQFSNLKAVLISTFGKGGAIGIALAGVGLLIAAVSSLFKKNNDLIEAQKAYTKGVVDARIEVANMVNVFEQAKKGVISKEAALKTYNDGLGQTIGLAKDLNEAEKILTDNAANYIKVQGLKAKANLLQQISVQLETNAELAREAGAAKTFKKQIEADEKRANELKEKIKEIYAEINSLSTNFKPPPPPATRTGRGAGGTTENPDLRSRIGIEGILSQHDLDVAEEQAQKEKNRRIEEEQAAHQDKLTSLFKGYVDNQAAIDLQDTRNKEDQANAREKLSEEEAQARLRNAQAVADALNSLADLAGQQTATGKALGIASAIINTYVGASKALSQGGILGIAMAASVIASGLAQVKRIMAVQVPGRGSSSNNSLASAPLSPQATSTRINQSQVNQIGNAAAGGVVRAFVVEHDITTNQERIRRLNRQARL